MLTSDDAGLVLSQLLARHTELPEEAESLAGDVLTVVDLEAVAADVVRVFQRLHFTAIADRTGRQRGGYVHEVDAGWHVLEEALQPWCDDVCRRARGGFGSAAVQQALGVVAGLYRLQTEAHAESLLGWMDAAENAPELAEAVLRVLADAGLTPPEEALADAAPDWYA